MQKIILIGVLILLVVLRWQTAWSQDLDRYDDEAVVVMKDPGEKANRVIFKTNNKIYQYGLKPAAKVWRKIIPVQIRQGLDRSIKLYTGWPKRVINSVLQLELKETGREFIRPIIDLPTLGTIAISEKIGLKETKTRKNFDSTLKKWGVPYGCYIVWPLLGPSSARGTVGLIADMFSNPVGYFLLIYETVGVFVFDEFNRYSLNYEQYDDFDKAALDYYIAVRNAYFQKTE